MDDVDAQLADASAALEAAVEAALPGWVVRSSAGLPGGDEAGRRAAEEIGAELRALLAADVDAQWTNPLALLRGAVRYPTAVLAAAGVPAVARDEYDEAHFPDDAYGLTPRTFADVDPALAEVGLRWGAAKAFAHRARHQPRSA